MTRFYIFTLMLSAAGAFASNETPPSISYKGGVLVATPASDEKADGPSVDIIETEECSASPVSHSSVKINGKCEFLKAVYSYQHREPTSGRTLRTYVGFTFSGHGAGHSLMVSGPFVSVRPN